MKKNKIENRGGKRENAGTNPKYKKEVPTKKLQRTLPDDQNIRDQVDKAINIIVKDYLYVK